ncbi:hypothetical protein ANCCAN_11688 [Ancylostoma caninum]|uniref:Uncharacterized protein n=1 Tax=Ancylostoma caninum TaxID=29170 RepID=A0A368GD60_ANCCA|nr:hypothetical protein ANCCAN_11688 [Ancylostoma caninum]
MDESNFSISRRNSLESSTTSEFEVVSRERSVSGSTLEAGTHLEEEPPTEIPSPPASLRIPALYAESTKSEDVLPDSSFSKPSWSIDDDLCSLANSISQLSESCVSDVSMMGRDTMGMLEQVYHELTLIKGRNNLLERTVEQANEWRDKANRLEEQNRILQKSLRTSKNRVEQLTQEVDNSKQREEKLTSSLKEFEERQTQRSGTSWYYQVMALCIIVAAIGMYIDCYAQA